MSPTLLVTGASGFIGSELVRILAPRYRLLGLSRVPRPPDPRLLWFQADISRPEEVARAFREMGRLGRIDGIVHLAAHIDLLDRPSEKWESVNVGGTENLLREAVGHGVRFFVYASSVVVMDSPGTIAFLDESAVRKAKLHYAASKLRGEEAVERYVGRLKAVILRIASVYSRSPHLSYLNYRIGSIFNGDLSTRFLPAPLAGGMAYVDLRDVCGAYERLLERLPQTRLGEILAVSEEGYLPHSVVAQIVHLAFAGRPPAILPIPILLAKWGTVLRHLWERLFHPRIHLRPWMAEFAALPFCVDTRKAKRELGWTPENHVTDHLRRAAADLLGDPVRWFRERDLRPKSAWVRGVKRGMLGIWDVFLCRFLLDAIKIARAYLPGRVKTLVEDGEMAEWYRRIAGESKPQGRGVPFNLHRVELPCRIPWRFLLDAVALSWPTSLVHFVRTEEGYDYRLFGRWNILHFRKADEVPGASLCYEVTSGFAAGGFQTFSMRQDPEDRKFYLCIETRVPRGQLFPVRIHNFYTAEHLYGVLRNLFAFRLKKGENLLASPASLQEKEASK